MIEEGYISFKEMCARFEATPRTLRYYEYIELLDPKKIGRTRYYGPREIARMKLILRGRRFGFSLEDIRQWLTLYDQQGTKEQYKQWIGLADRQYEALAAQMTELKSVMAELQQLRDETVVIVADLEAAAQDSDA